MQVGGPWFCLSVGPSFCQNCPMYFKPYDFIVIIIIIDISKLVRGEGGPWPMTDKWQISRIQSEGVVVLSDVRRRRRYSRRLRRMSTIYQGSLARALVLHGNSTRRSTIKSERAPTTSDSAWAPPPLFLSTTHAMLSWNAPVGWQTARHRTARHPTPPRHGHDRVLRRPLPSTQRTLTHPKTTRSSSRDAPPPETYTDQRHPSH